MPPPGGYVPSELDAPTLRSSNASQRQQRAARVLQATTNASLKTAQPSSALNLKPRAHDVGRLYEGDDLDALLTGRNCVFADCAPRQLRALHDVSEQVRYDRYAQLLVEGRLSPSMRYYYLLVEGRVAVRTVRGYERELGPGDAFGELSLIAERPCTWAAHALTRVLCVRIAAEALTTRALRASLMVALPKVELRAKLTLLRSLPFFSALSDEALRLLAPYFNYAERPAGAVLCYAGDSAESIYLVAFGAVEAVIDGARVGLCASSDDRPWIGELALLEHARRPASLRVAEPSHLFTIGVESLPKLMRVVPAFFEMLHSADLAVVYARMSLDGTAAAAQRASDWRELLGQNFFARRAHFAANVLSRSANGSSPGSRATLDPQVLF